MAFASMHSVAWHGRQFAAEAVHEERRKFRARQVRMAWLLKRVLQPRFVHTLRLGNGASAAPTHDGGQLPEQRSLATR